MTASAVRINVPQIGVESHTSVHTNLRTLKNASAFRSELAAHEANEPVAITVAGSDTSSPDSAVDNSRNLLRPSPLQDAKTNAKATPDALALLTGRSFSAPKATALPQVTDMSSSVTDPKAKQSKSGLAMPPTSMPTLPPGSKVKASKLPPRGDDTVVLNNPGGNSDLVAVASGEANVNDDLDDVESSIETKPEENDLGGSRSSKLESLSGTVAIDSPSQPTVTGDLAVALQVSPGGVGGHPGSDTPGLPMTPMSSSAASVHLQTQSAEGAMGAPAKLDGATQFPTGVSTQQGQLADDSQSPAAEQSSSSSQADFASQLEQYQRTPVRGVHVQVAGADNQKLDIRMYERAGQLAVTMRSSDTIISQALQDHSSELTTHLALEHYQTELWTPGSSTNPDGHSSGNNQSFSQSNDSPTKQNSNQKEGNPQQPAWVDQLEQLPIGFQKRIENT